MSEIPQEVLEAQVLGAQLRICVWALTRIESDKGKPLRERPWAIAEEALAESRRVARELMPDVGTKVKPSRYSVANL